MSSHPSDAPPPTVPTAPDFVDRSPDGRVVLGFNAPVWGADADRADDLVTWAVHAAHAGIDAISAGTHPLDGAPGYDIAFISAYDQPEQADALVAELTEPLATHQARPVWMVHDPDPASRLRRANDDLAGIIQPLAHEGRGLLLWATVVGDFREYGLNHYNPRTQTSLPYEGELPATVERAILAHKRSFFEATGEPWVALRALYQPDDLPPLVQTDTEAPLPWTHVPAEAWEAERQRFPKH